MERQSALQHCHLEAHAHLQTFAGWRLPARYTEPDAELDLVRASVGISDASYLSKIDLRDYSGEFPLHQPAQRWELTRTHSLIISPLSIDFAPSPSLTDVTSIYSAILLAGPKSRAVLQKLTTLNVRESAMPDGAARQARLAHVNAILLRTDSAGLPGFLLLNTRDVAEHVWTTLLHAGAHPFGMLAQQQWLDHDA